MRGQHSNQSFHNTGWCVELPTFLAFGTGKLSQKVFIHLAQNIACCAGIAAKTDGGNHIDQFAQLTVGQLGAAIALVQNPFELGVFCFDGGQGVVDALTDIRLLGGGAQRFPTGGFGYPEDVGRGVIVAVFQFGGEFVFAGIWVVVLVDWVGEALQ